MVEAPDGPALVIAGAGSGKTRALTHRVARLIARGAAPDRILLATFTNRAAREMLRRVEELTGVDTRAMWAGTFHHVAHRILRLHGRAVGLPERFGVIDRGDARELLGRCLDEAEVRRVPPALAQAVLSRAAGRGLTLERALAEAAPRLAPEAGALARAADRFARRKAQMAVLDFDDLLLLWKLILVESEPARRDLGERFQHVLVDEYQDVNPLQAELVERAAAEHRRLMVVGDDAQSIYRFRGAELALLTGFGARFPDARLYRLETNYRSTPEIVALANHAIARNLGQVPKRLRAVRGGGAPPTVIAAEDARAQAEWVVEAALARRAAGRPLAAQAVLYRSHAHALELQVALARRGVPFALRSGPRFFEQAHVKDAVAYLRVVDNARDELAWSRVLQCSKGIGRRLAAELLPRLTADGRGALAEVAGVLPPSRRAPVAKLADLLDELAELGAGAPPAAVVRAVVERAYREHALDAFDDAEQRLDDLARLAAWAERLPTLDALLADLALVASVGAEGMTGGDDGDRLTLSTVHQAKGLEWATVYVVWLADGHFPPAVTLRGSPEEEEERRLFYVAVTRARDELHLLYPAFVEQREGTRARQLASRFLVETELT